MGSTSHRLANPATAPRSRIEHFVTAAAGECGNRGLLDPVRRDPLLRLGCTE